MTSPTRFGPIAARVLLLGVTVVLTESCGPEINFPSEIPPQEYPPGTTARPYAAFLRGRQDTLNFHAVDADGDRVLSVIADLTALPPNHDAALSTDIEPSTGRFKCRLLWTAQESDTEIYPVAFTAIGASTGAPDTTLLYTVDHAVDIDPVITCPDTVHVAIGVPQTIAVTAVDPDGDPLFEFVPEVHVPGSDLNYRIRKLSWTRTLSGSTAAGTLQIRVDGPGWFPVRFQAINAAHGYATTLVIARPS